MTPLRHVLYALAGLLAVLVYFELTPVDMVLQARLYDTAGGGWWWDRNEPVARFLLYDGIKALYVLFAAALLALLVLFRKRRFVAGNRRGLFIVLLSLVLVPLAANMLKASTNVACPRALSQFGGSLPYVKLLEPYPAGRRPAQRQRCFPAGHASGGFALMSLYYLPGSWRRRRYALLFGLVAGWTTGLYKMVIGDHYLSHTVVSMLMAWLIINAVAAAVQRCMSAPGADRPAA